VNEFIIGITGPSGTGKTTVCDILKKRCFHIINADEVYAKLIVKGQDCYKAIVGTFGIIILDKNNCIDRQRLARIVFNNKKKLELLNTIAHKFVVQEIKEQINFIYNQNNRIILDVPLLFESNCNELCFKTITVIADETTMVKRIMKRDNLEIIDATLRVRNQKKIDFYEEKSDFILKNNFKTVEELEICIDNIINECIGT